MSRRRVAGPTSARTKVASPPATEFSGLEFYLGELISIGMVKFCGEELYLELEYEGAVSDFVRREVLPKLTGPKVAPAEAAARIKAFVGDGRPYLVSEGGHYDAIYVNKLFGIEEQPFNWVPLDFVSMLFSHGIKPRTDDLARELGLDRSQFRADHALDDARFLRALYLRATAGTER